MYEPRPVSEVTTEDLIVTIAADRNDVATFEARVAFTARTRSDWRAFAPTCPRTAVTGDGHGPIYFHSFAGSGLL